MVVLLHWVALTMASYTRIQRTFVTNEEEFSVSQMGRAYWEPAKVFSWPNCHIAKIGAVQYSSCLSGSGEFCATAVTVLSQVEGILFTGDLRRKLKKKKKNIQSSGFTAQSPQQSVRSCAQGQWASTQERSVHNCALHHPSTKLNILWLIINLSATDAPRLRGFKQLRHSRRQMMKMSHPTAWNDQKLDQEIIWCVLEMLIGEREVFNHSKCVFTRLIRPVFITWKQLFVMNCLVGFNILNNAVVYLVAVLLLG